jgi:hypothetical protein
MGKLTMCVTQKDLERVERKVDRVLELLEGKELSVSVVLGGKEIGTFTTD